VVIRRARGVFRRHGEHSPAIASGLQISKGVVADHAGYRVPLETLLTFDETEYLALLLWRTTAGAGTVSIDRLLKRT
jgi:hypothetical protein